MVNPVYELFPGIEIGLLIVLYIKKPSRIPSRFLAPEIHGTS
jgi:hypothetical protein